MRVEFCIFVYFISKFVRLKFVLFVCLCVGEMLVLSSLCISRWFLLVLMLLVVMS